MKSQFIRKLWVPAFLAVLAIFSMACGLFTTVANGVANKVGNAVLGQGQAGTVTQLWTDVPKMNGLNQENLDLPLAAKVAVEGFMKASMGGNGTVNFIAYTTSSPAKDVTDFYSVDKMTSAGWNGQGEPGCTTVDTQSTSSGEGVCFFQKDEGNNKSALLAIFIGQDPSTNKTQVFFMRVDAISTATATP